MPDDPEKDLVDALDLSLVQKLRLGIAWGVMKEILYRLWNDPAYFTGIGRALLGLLAQQILSGTIPVPPGKVGQVIWWIATYWPAVLAFPAGQTNKTPGEIKQIAQDPTVTPTPPKP